MRRILKLSIALLPLLALTQDRDFSGLVIGITDGDTLTVLNSDREQVRVRLAEIDAPEDGQPWGNRARQALSELAFQNAVQVRYMDTDQYGRIVGRLYVDEIDISAEMVRSGNAWVYREYVTDESLFAFEESAREEGRGLWGISEAAVPPWEWRQNPGQPVIELGDPFTCGSKNVCRQMLSCEEARFYLNQCAVSSLDGDGDGIPCENICR